MWVQIPSGGKVMAKACEDAHQASPSALLLPEGKSVSDGLRSFSFCRLWSGRPRAVFRVLLGLPNFFCAICTSQIAQIFPTIHLKLCATCTKEISYFLLTFAPFCDIILVYQARERKRKRCEKNLKKFSKTP